MKLKILLILLLFSLSFLAIGQDESGSGEGGSGKKIWEPDLIELWIYWHKQQYRMLQEFSHNEDTLNTVQHQNLRDYMEDLRKVDEILFKQFQDNDMPKPLHMIPEAALAGEIMINIVKIDLNAKDMVLKAPFDEEVAVAYIQANIRTTKEMIELVTVATNKYLNGWNKQNLRDNDVRDNLSDYILKKLETIQGNWNLLYKKWETSKHEAAFKNVKL